MSWRVTRRRYFWKRNDNTIIGIFIPRDIETEATSQKVDYSQDQEIGSETKNIPQDEA